MKKCPKCGKENVDGAKFCRYCGTLINQENQADNTPIPTAPVVPLPATKIVVQESPKPKISAVSNDTYRRKSGAGSKIFICIAFLLLLVAGGVFWYKNIYMPAKIDRESPRYYPFAERTFLRSSQVAGIDANKLGTLQYGSELIVYNYSSDWAYVKSSSGKKGYVSSDFLMEKKDFYILNSIWGDSDSRAVISTSKCRRALLHFYKNNGLIGIMNPDVWDEAFPGDNLNDYDSGWQVFCMPKKSKYNYVYYARITNPKSKFTDFCVIIRNVYNGERKIVLFSFDDDETDHFIAASDASQDGLIRRVYRDSYGTYRVEYASE